MKLIARGFAPSRKPWKLLVRHRLQDAQLQHYGRWSRSAQWVIGTKLPLKKKGSDLWQSTIQAWQELQGGLIHIPPTYQDEIKCQPLFGNSLLTDLNGKTWRMTAKDRFITWDAQGIRLVGDLWSDTNNDWLPDATIKRLTCSRSVPTQRTRLFNSELWSPQIATPYSSGDW
jgi:hypothetical protein